MVLVVQLTKGVVVRLIKASQITADQDLVILGMVPMETILRHPLSHAQKDADVVNVNVMVKHPKGQNFH